MSRVSGFARADGLVIVALLVWAVALYRPWVDLPQPVKDMPEILSILQRAPSVASGTSDLIAHYANEGRFMPGSMAALAVFHGLFGTAGTDWRWARFLLCGIVTLGAYVLYRRLRLGRLGAAAGASLFVVADAALPGWLMPQVMEPLAVVFLVSALAFALGYRSTASRWRTTVAIGLSLVAAIWVKEPMIAAVPFVLLVALTWCDGEWSLPRRFSDVSTLVIGVGALLLLLNIVPIASIRMANDSPNYASRYSIDGFSLSTWSNSFRASMLPVTRVPWFPANVAAAALVAVGIGFAGRDGRRTHLPLLGAAALLPLAVALIYAPWPSFPGYYALPGLVGLGLIIGASVDRANLVAAPRRHVALLLGVVVVAFGSLMAFNAFQRYRAERQLEASVARSLTQAPPASSLVLGARDTALSGAFGRSLVRYTRLFAGPTALRDGVDVPCESAELTARSAGVNTVVVAFLDDCRLAHGVDEVLRTRFTRWDWKTLQRRPDSVGAVIVSGSRGAGT